MLPSVTGQLKVGQKVMWRGAWGNDPAQEATITDMELCAKGSKNGRTIKTAKWNTVKGYGKGQIIVTLDNGHWAYGDQLDKIK